MDDDLIEVYLSNCVGEFKADEYRKSIQIFDTYGVVAVFTDLQGIIARHSATNGEVVQDLFEVRIKQELQGMLASLFISVNEDTSLEKLNELLMALKLIENLEDYDEIHDIIFSWEDNETIIARLASKFTMISAESFMENIQQVEPLTIDTLKELVTRRQYNAEQAMTQEPNRIKQLQDFVACFPENQVAPSFLGASPDFHIPFATYMTAYGSEIASDDVVQTARNILFFLLLSGDGFHNSTPVFDENAKIFRFSDEHRDAVRQAIINAAGTLAEHRRVMNEQARISSQGS